MTDALELARKALTIFCAYMGAPDHRPDILCASLIGKGLVAVTYERDSMGEWAWFLWEWEKIADALVVKEEGRPAEQPVHLHISTAEEAMSMYMSMVAGPNV